jgi:hypothetical protein
MSFLSADITAESTVEEVKAWAMTKGVSEKASQMLVDNELDGAAVLELSKLPQEKIETKLVSVPYSLPGGSAVKLAKAISDLGSTAQGTCCEPTPSTPSHPNAFHTCAPKNPFVR